MERVRRTAIRSHIEETYPVITGHQRYASDEEIDELALQITNGYHERQAAWAN